MRGTDGGVERWKDEAKDRMASTVYAEESLPYFYGTVVRNTARLERYADLYEPF
jgi:hypothetical protein